MLLLTSKFYRILFGDIRRLTWEIMRLWWEISRCWMEIRRIWRWGVWRLCSGIKVRSSKEQYCKLTWGFWGHIQNIKCLLSCRLCYHCTFIQCFKLIFTIFKIYQINSENVEMLKSTLSMDTFTFLLWETLQLMVLW